MKLTRRKFLIGAGCGAAVLAGGAGYSAWEAGWYHVREDTITVPRLPAEFSGLRVVFVSDLHHGPWTGLGYIASTVDAVNALNPDLILLGGDYVHKDAAYILPVFSKLKKLRAPLGVFGVLGNHDHWQSAEQTQQAMHDSGITELTNTGVWLKKGLARLRLCGVGDLWCDLQRPDDALADCAASDACVMLSHNPDYAENLTDSRVGLMLSGHTHGGQVVIPVVGPLFVPSKFGSKYLSGLVAAPATQVFVSRGLGTIGLPLRFYCRPEINLLTLI